MSDVNHTLNTQVADALVAINAMVVATAPSMALGTQLMTLSFQQALASYNAVYAQQQGYITHQSASAADVMAILGR